MMAMGALSSLGMFAVLGWLTNAGWFVEAFHFNAMADGQIVPVLLLFCCSVGSSPLVIAFNESLIPET